MSRFRIRLAAVAAAGLLLAACGGADDTAGEPSTTAAPADAAQDDDADGGDATEDDTADMDADATQDDADADTGDDADMGDDADDMGDGMEMSDSYGEPADASAAERTIEVTVDDELTFDPAEFEVAAGEVVTFRVTNIGAAEHEFVLGDEQAQQQMAEDMAGGDDHAHSGDMSNAVTIHGGETAELTWRFPDESTTVLIGCHVPGHYQAGMRGSVAVG